MLAERIGSLMAMLLCTAAAVIGCALIPFLIASPLIWPVIFVWGAVAFGIYTMSLIGLGERFSGSMLITGNAAFALFWGLGGIAGPPATGALMDVVGVQGLPVALGLLCGALGASILWSERRGA